MSRIASLGIFLGLACIFLGFSCIFLGVVVDCSCTSLSFHLFFTVDLPVSYSIPWMFLGLVMYFPWIFLWFSWIFLGVGQTIETESFSDRSFSSSVLGIHLLFGPIVQFVCLDGILAIGLVRCNFLDFFVCLSFKKDRPPVLSSECATVCSEKTSQPHSQSERQMYGVSHEKDRPPVLQAECATVCSEKTQQPHSRSERLVDGLHWKKL